MPFHIHAPEVTMTIDKGEKPYVCLGAFASNPETSWDLQVGVRAYLFADTVGTVNPDGSVTVGLQLDEGLDLPAEPGFAPGTWNWTAGTYMASCPAGGPDDTDVSWMLDPLNLSGTYTIECNQLPFVIDVPLTLQP
jgi:hypothetical protein